MKLKKQLPQISHKAGMEGLRTWEDVIWQGFSLNLIMCVIFPTGAMKSLCSQAEESLEDLGTVVPGEG